MKNKFEEKAEAGTVELSEKQEVFVEKLESKFADALEAYKFSKAKGVIDDAPWRKLRILGNTLWMSFNDERLDALLKSFGKRFAPKIKEVLGGLIEDGDGRHFMEAIQSVGELIQIKPEDLGETEKLKSPEIIDEAKRALIIEMKRYPTHFGFTHLRDKLEQAGIIDANEANQIDEIRQEAVKKLITEFKQYPTAFAFIRARDQMAEAGIVDASEINQLEAVQSEARKKLVAELKRYPTTYAFIEMRDQMAEAGIVDAGEVNEWPEIRKELEKRTE